MRYGNRYVIFPKQRKKKATKMEFCPGPSNIAQETC